MDKENSGEPSGANLFRIADRWKVSARWLATGEGDMIQRVAMESDALTPEAIEIAREFDGLKEPLLRAHYMQQIGILRAAQENGRLDNFLKHETSRVTKRTNSDDIGLKAKKRNKE